MKARVLSGVQPQPRAASIKKGYGVQSYTRMQFEWDPKKAANNAHKHGIQFADAVGVLEDDRAITIADDAADEERWVTIGVDAFGRILTVVYTWRSSSIRIISARRATRGEISVYSEQR